MKMISTALIAIASSCVMAQEVSVKTLLPQMTDLTFLTHRPQPVFKMAQASSYDRRSNPGPNSDPFANGDAGNFVRIEDGAKGKEFVMADLKGPGSVVRLWSANPSGTIRFYFDGEAKPRIEAKMSEFLTGKTEGLGEPFGYTASSGADVYFPFPYSKSLKITAGESNGESPKSLYYHVGFRTYDPSTKVKTFTWADLTANKKLMETIGQGLLHPANDTGIKNLFRGTLESRKTLTTSYQAQISSAIRTLQVKVPVPTPDDAKAMTWEDPRQLHNILRNIVLRIQFDGEQCVSVPLGDFFGSAPGLNPYENLPMTVSPDGSMACRFVMPFEKSAIISVQNLGPDVPFLMNASIKPFPWGPHTYHFHAQWLGEKSHTRPFHEMPFLDVNGEGFFVGTNLHVASPAPDWWGEGDEKAYVDGESFPSTFGTGSEDYYGYAWGSPDLFTRPYHAQTRCDGPGSLGHTSLNRWQVFDPISYTSSMKFTLEMWHWADCIATFVHTTYWYSKPGGTPSAEIEERLLLPPKIDGIKPIEGAIEGEGLKIKSVSGGKAEAQDGFWQISAGKQLWWQEPKTGDKLILEVPIAEAGTYEVFGNFCHARDYGIHKMTLNGQAIDPVDFYGTGLEWKKQSLGTFTLPKGTVTLEVECMGHHKDADPKNMFGLDYLILSKKQ